MFNFENPLHFSIKRHLSFPHFRKCENGMTGLNGEQPSALTLVYLAEPDELSVRKKKSKKIVPASIDGPPVITPSG